MATSNITFVSGSNSSSFGNSTQPTGSHFKNPVLVAAIVVNGVCAICFVLLVIASWWIKGKKEKGRRPFGVLSGLLGTMFVSYLRTTGDEITHEFNANQPVVYLALRVIGQILTAGTDTTLPFVVYRVIKNRLSHIKNDANGYNAIHYAHLGIAVLVVLLGVIASFLFSYGQIFIEIHTTEEAYGINISNWYMYIQLTYTSVYCGVTLEMLACAVFIFKKSGPTNTQSRISKYLVAIVTPFLVIRSAVNLAFTVFYVYLAHDEQDSAGVLNAVLLGIPSVVLYAGLVLIGFEKDWYLRDATVSYVEFQQDGYGSSAFTQQYDGQAKQPLQVRYDPVK